MAKNPNGKSTPAKRNSDSLNGAMIFFLIGCVAEFYLFMIRRYYVDGTISEVVAWDAYLKNITIAGAVALIVGAVLAYLWRKQKTKMAVGCWIGGIGAFLALSGVFIRHYIGAGVTLLSVVLPVVMILALLWSFYDRECSVSLTILSLSLIVLWVCRRKLPDLTWHTYIMAGAVVYLVLLAGVAWLAKNGKLAPILPKTADMLPVYAACGLSAIGILSVLISTTAAYYVMWGLAVVVFALAVYYTIKML